MALLVPKARAALARYGHQVVIGNELHSRKHQVVFVSRRPGSDCAETWVRLAPEEQDAEIEVKIVVEEVTTETTLGWRQETVGRTRGGVGGCTGYQRSWVWQKRRRDGGFSI